MRLFLFVLPLLVGSRAPAAVKEELMREIDNLSERAHAFFGISRDPIAKRSAYVTRLPKNVELANSLFGYYEARFGVDMSGLSFFSPINFDELRQFVNRLGKSQWFMEYSSHCIRVDLDFGVQTGSFAMTYTVPSLFTLNELNKIIQQVNGYYGTRGISVLDSSELAHIETHLSAMRSFFAHEDHVFDNLVRLIVSSKNNLDYLGLSSHELTKGILGCMFSVLSLYSRFPLARPSLYHTAYLLHGYATYPRLSDGFRKSLLDLYGALRLAEFNQIVTRPVDYNLLNPIKKKAKLVEKSFHSAPNIFTDKLKGSIEVFNTVVARMVTYFEKPYHWFLSEPKILSVEAALRDPVEEVHTPLFTLPEYLINESVPKLDLKQKVTQIASMLTTCTSYDASTFFLSVFVAKSVEEFHRTAIRGCPRLSVQFRTMRKRMTSAVEYMTTLDFVRDTKQYNSMNMNAHKVLRIFGAVKANEHPEILTASEFAHMLFDVTLYLWLQDGDDVFGLAGSILDRLIARVSRHNMGDVLGETGLEVLRQMHSEARMILEEPFKYDINGMRQRVMNWKALMYTVEKSDTEYVM